MFSPELAVSLSRIVLDTLYKYRAVDMSSRPRLSHSFRPLSHRLRYLSLIPKPRSQSLWSLSCSLRPLSLIPRPLSIVSGLCPICLLPLGLCLVAPGLPLSHRLTSSSIAFGPFSQPLVAVSRPFPLSHILWPRLNCVWPLSHNI